MKKYILFVILTLGLPIGLKAQSVPVTPTDKATIEAKQAAVDSITASAAKQQAQMKTIMADLSWKYSTAQTALTGAIDTARKKLGLPSNATFDGTSFAFTIPAPTPPAASPAIGPNTPAPPKK